MPQTMRKNLSTIIRFFAQNSTSVHDHVDQGSGTGLHTAFTSHKTEVQVQGAGVQNLGQNGPKCLRGWSLLALQFQGSEPLQPRPAPQFGDQ